MFYYLNFVILLYNSGLLEDMINEITIRYNQTCKTFESPGGFKMHSIDRTESLQLLQI